VSLTFCSSANQCRKTQIALAYVYWLRETQPDLSIFWVHASSVGRFRQAIAFIAQECQIAGYDDPKADILSLVKAWLERKEHGRWLMVIDNADDTQLFFSPPEEAQSTEVTDQGARLGHYVPECAHGSILVTTRNKQVGLRLSKGASPIEVTKMDDDESVQLLRARLEEHNVDRSELSVLSAQLDHLPLALVQAAAFIQENSTTVSEYLQLLSGSDSELIDLLSEEFETVGRDSETPRAVTRAWMISFEQIQQQDAIAGELLSLMAFFDRQAIAVEFLACYREQRQGERWSKIQLQKALGILKAFCFVTVAKDQSLDIHRLVQLVTRKWLTNKGIQQQFAEQALVVVSEQYPFGEYENWKICSRYLPHVYAVLNFKDMESPDGKMARGLLLHNAARYLLDQGLWEEAEQLQGEAVEQYNTALGTEHLFTMTSMANLATTYRNQGRWKEAEKLEVQVMETRKTKLGVDHPETLTSIANLALTYRDQGRWVEAEKLFVQVMETRKTKLGVDHLNTLTSMANLASTFWDQGRWEEAEKLFVQVIETRKTKLGVDHPDTLISINNLASTFWDQGRWEEAEKLFVQVMETRKTKLGADHPDTLTSMANLASTYTNQGRWEEAEKLEVQVMETRKTKLGADHPDTLISMNNLAFTWKDMGHHKDALDLIQKCSELQQSVLGLNHPLTKSTLLAMTTWQLDVGSESQEGSVKSVQ
jgi:tetratricopeptide (TPR) repeat protein